MKIKPEHYATMLEAMRTTQAKSPGMTRQHYINAKIGKDHAKRHRWDLFHAAGLTRFACDTLYAYVNDTHIDTALRSIVAELEAAPELVPA